MFKPLRAYLARDGLGPSLVRSLAGSAGIRIVGMGFGFLVGVQLARGLGASGYGVYGLAMSMVSMLAIPAEFGLPQLATREVASSQVRRDWVAIGELLRWALRTLLWMALLTLVVASLLGWWRYSSLDTALVHALVAGLLFVVLAPLGNLYGAALRGLQHVVSGQVPEVVLRPVLFSAFLFISTFLMGKDLNPATAMALHVASVGIAAACACALLRHHLPVESKVLLPRASTARSRQWLSSAWPLALTEAMRVVHGNVAILALGVISTTTAVGVFRVGSSTSALLTMPISLFHIVLSPVVARLHAAGESRKLERLMGWSSLAMAASVGLLCLPFFFAGEQILPFMFGDEFSDANASLLILSAGAALGCLFGPGAILLNMTGHERRVTRSLAVSLVTLCLLLVPFSHYLDGVGAALAVALSSILWSGLMWWEARNLLGTDASVAALRRQWAR
ncbi:MAG: oligosaccharide flippase family protein [Burkholderiaceae bacterium]